MDWVLLDLILGISLRAAMPALQKNLPIHPLLLRLTKRLESYAKYRCKHMESFDQQVQTGTSVRCIWFSISPGTSLEEAQRKPCLSLHLYSD